MTAETRTDPLTGLLTVRSHGGTVRAAVPLRLPTTSPLAEVTLDHGGQMWIRTADGKLWLASEQSGTGLSWGHNGGGPLALAILLGLLLDDIGAAAPAGYPQAPGLLAGTHGGWRTGCTLTRADLEAAYRNTRPGKIDSHTNRRYGETGQKEDIQLEADRKWWPVARARQERLRGSVYVVNGTVTRIRVTVTRIRAVQPHGTWRRDDRDYADIPLTPPLTGPEIAEQFPALGIKLGDHARTYAARSANTSPFSSPLRRRDEASALTASYQGAPGNRFRGGNDLGIQCLAGEVFTFGVDLRFWKLIWGSPTG